MDLNPFLQENEHRQLRGGQEWGKLPQIDARKQESLSVSEVTLTHAQAD